MSNTSADLSNDYILKRFNEYRNLIVVYFFDKASCFLTLIQTKLAVLIWTASINFALASYEKSMLASSTKFTNGVTVFFKSCNFSWKWFTTCAWIDTQLSIPIITPRIHLVLRDQCQSEIVTAGHLGYFVIPERIHEARCRCTLGCGVLETFQAVLSNSKLRIWVVSHHIEMTWNCKDCCMVFSARNLFN